MATRFTSQNLFYHGGYLTVAHNGKQEFVARFKYGGRGRFVRFLKKHFTVEEYLAALATKLPNGYMQSPVGVLETKGFDPLSPKQRASFNNAMLQRACEELGHETASM